MLGVGSSAGPAGPSIDSMFGEINPTKPSFLLLLPPQKLLWALARLLIPSADAVPANLSGSLGVTVRARSGGGDQRWWFLVLLSHRSWVSLLSVLSLRALPAQQPQPESPNHLPEVTSAAPALPQG